MENDEIWELITAVMRCVTFMSYALPGFVDFKMLVQICNLMIYFVTEKYLINVYSWKTFI